MSRAVTAAIRLVIEMDWDCMGHATTVLFQPEGASGEVRMPMLASLSAQNSQQIVLHADLRQSLWLVQVPGMMAFEPTLGT